MSYHVYLARAGWKTTSITLGKWRSAATAVPALDVSVREPDGGLLVHLAGQRRQWLAWQDGVVFAQNPDEQLVGAMFLLAERLGAQVYSERQVPYRDVDDLRRRTQAAGAPYWF